MGPDIAAMAGDENFHAFLQIVRQRVPTKQQRMLFDSPWRLSGIPKLIQVLSVTLGIHRIPETTMLSEL